MNYYKETKLKNGKKIILRSCTIHDAENVLFLFNKTHEETDNLLTYPEENTFTLKDEEKFLDSMHNSENEIEIIAVIDGVAAGTAGIQQVGNKIKIKHRAELGISVLREYWSIGIGKALTEACIECAVKAGYEQIELNVIAENKNAVEMYKKCGFEEIGRNPRGFKNKEGKYQTLLYMAKVLR